MHALIDISHPAHVHFFRPLREMLVSEGHTVEVVARDKDVTHRLLDAAGIEYTSLGRSGRLSRLTQAEELIRRVAGLVRIGRRRRPDIILTRNPAGVQAARLLGCPGIFDTDDGRAAGVTFHAAAPFASIITTPSSIAEDYGRRHRVYDGYKALAYLHPDRFAGDVDAARAHLGVNRGERLFVLRFVSMTASHDFSESGMPASTKLAVARELAERGRVVITSEPKLPADLDGLRMEIPPEMLHSVLAAADLYVGDSQTVAAEAAILGTPGLRLSSWTGRLAYLDELEEQYGLLQSFRPDESARFEAALQESLEDLDGLAERAAKGRAQMLADKEDVTLWYRELVEEVVAGRARR